MRRLLEKFAGRWVALGHDRRGVALLETALVIPVLIVMLLGGYEVARYALLQQKLTRTVISTADLVTQGETISAPELDSILSAASFMMQPFADESAQNIIVTSITATSAGVPKIDWQRPGGGSLTGVASKLGTTVGATATLPTGFTVAANTNAIFAEIFYQFSPTFAADIVPPQTLYQLAVFRPRVTALSTLCANLNCQ
jgi:Flp pilus assembly protein TadG